MAAIAVETEETVDATVDGLREADASCVSAQLVAREHGHDAHGKHWGPATDRKRQMLVIGSAAITLAITLVLHRGKIPLDSGLDLFL
jgi:hypothetical protein